MRKGDTVSEEPLENLVHEGLTFPPPPEFAAQANGTADLYDQAAADHDGFWAEQARTYLHWNTPFTQSLDWSNPPFAKWFADGELNGAYNASTATSRPATATGSRSTARASPATPATSPTPTCTREVKRAANVLADLGVGKGDRVAIYLPMIPEAVVAMLACARIGAVALGRLRRLLRRGLRSRIDDAEAKLVITADGGYRRGAPVALKPAVDDALDHGDTSRRARARRQAHRPGHRVERPRRLVARGAREGRRRRTRRSPSTPSTRSSSSTRRAPPGSRRASCTRPAATSPRRRTRNAVVLDLHPETDVYWCTADVGWVTGHSYIVYGPLANGATQVIYEGTPDTPHPGRWWEIVQKYKVTILYTAPTAIRTFMKWGAEIPAKFDLTSLRLLGSVGEPINPEAWIWYRELIGGGRAPIVDTWWQTETGAIMISPLPGVTTLKPGSAQVPLPGISADVVDDEGKPFTTAEQAATSS